MSDNASPTPNGSRGARFNFNKWMKPVRRVHMYLGLLLLPWVLVFGISGFLFNHNSRTFGGPFETLREFTALEVSELVEWRPTPAEKIAKELVRQMNRDGAKFAVVPGTPEIAGGVIYQTQINDRATWIRIDVERGNAAILDREPAPPEQHLPPFQDASLASPYVDHEMLSRTAESLAKAAGFKTATPPKPIVNGQPLLRFQVTEPDGRSWNAVYNLGNGRLTGRATEDDSGMSFNRAVLRLHTTHGYPERRGARWFWVLMADAAALAMVVWSFTGLAMWWQIKRSRAVGAGALAIVILVAAVIFSGTLGEHFFGRDPHAKPISVSSTSE